MIAAGIGGVFSGQSRAYVKQDLHVAMEENLRAGLTSVADVVRMGGCGLPASDLEDWITWVSGFANDAVLVTDGGSGPDTMAVAACTPPLADLRVNAVAGSTTLVVDSYTTHAIGELFNDNDKALIWIGGMENALIETVSGSTITIDTDPTTNGAQGLKRAHPPGTPVSRIDVSTLRIQTDSETGLPALFIDKQRGSALAVADGISNLQVTTLEVGRRYRIALTARSEKHDPINGALLTRTLDTEITLRN
jgi:hypothetical protein